MMAPTEILARQHFENAEKTLGPLGIRCRLLTGSTKAAERKQMLTELVRGECDAVFGTHALISEKVRYGKLGLVITDEQHRFGVRQRSRLQEKGGEETERLPHVLVMSATPIPRTLALILYGDLDRRASSRKKAGANPACAGKPAGGYVPLPAAGAEKWKTGLRGLSAGGGFRRDGPGPERESRF